jgi:hypothetical protein
MEAYPRSRKTLQETFIELKQYPCVILTSNMELYRYLVKIGYSSIEVQELGIEESLLKLSEEKLPIDIIDMSEGNLGALYFMLEKQWDKILGLWFNRYYNLESGQRYILYYLSTRLGLSKITKKLGPQTYIYLDRLIKRGEVLKLGGKRGNYLVRNPLLRIYILRMSRPEKEDWWISGYFYLFLKLLTSIDNDKTINTLTKTLYISPILKVKRMDRYTARMLDRSKTTYTVYYSVHKEVPSIKKIFKEDRDIKVLIYPYQPTATLARRMKNSNISLIDISVISRIRDEMKFPRLI